MSDKKDDGQVEEGEISRSPTPDKRSSRKKRDRSSSRDVTSTTKTPSPSRRRERRRRNSRSRTRSLSRSRSVERYYGGKVDRDRRRTGNRSEDEDKSRYVGKRYYGEDELEKSKKRQRSNSNEKDDKPSADPKKVPERQKKLVDMITSKTGGAYIPPHKLRMMQAEITDKASMAYQRISWEALKKSIHGYINKINVDNIGIIIKELLRENIVRGRGLLCRSIIQAQSASPTFTHVYAALIAVINSKFPNIGDLFLKRLVIQFKRGFRRNDKNLCISSSRFIAHLINQRVAHEILALEILTLLVETPTDDSVEVAISFLKECGQKLTEVSGKGINAIFEMLKNILHEGKLDKRVQYMIEVVFQIRKDGFKDHIAVVDSLELVAEDEQFTHLITLEEATDQQEILNVFKFDPDYEVNEAKYKGLSNEILGSDASGSEGGSSSGSDSDSDGENTDDEAGEGGGNGEGKSKGDVIIDNTETNLIALRRTIYLTIHSSLDYEECAHKLMKMELKPGQEHELCHMFLDCCAEQRTYEKFYGLLAQRFCMINKIYIQPFEEIFKDTYHTTHRLDTNRLRNVSKFFAHLLFTDAIGWDVFQVIKLNEDDTTSSSRIFIKILFQELAEYMGMVKLNARLKDVTLQESFAGLFPTDNPKNTRFAINFFTSIGLGGLTDELRVFLKTAPKMIPAPLPPSNTAVELDSSSSSSSTSSSSSSSSSSSDSDSDSDDSDQKRRRRKKKKQGTKQQNKKDSHRKDQQQVKVKQVSRGYSDEEYGAHDRGRKHYEERSRYEKSIRDRDDFGRGSRSQRYKDGRRQYKSQDRS